MKKYLNKILILKEFSWIVVGQIASVIGMLVLVRLQTEFLSPTEYGYLTLGLTIVVLFNQTLVGGLSSGFARFLCIAIDNGKILHYMKACNSLMVLAFLFSALVFSTLGVFISYAIELQSNKFLFIILLFSLSNNYNSSTNSIQNAARNRSIVALNSSSEVWLKVVCALMLLYFFENKLESVVYSYLISSIIINLLQCYFLRKKLNWKFSFNIKNINNEWTLKILKFAWPFALWGVFSWLQISSSRWSLEIFCSTNDVGRFAVLYQLGYVPIGFVLGLFVNLLYPLIYQKAGDATKRINNLYVGKLIWKITFVTLFSTSICTYFAYISHELLFKLLVSNEYREISIYFPLMIIAGGLSASGQLLSLKLMSDIKTNHLIFPKIGSSLIGFILSFYFAYYYDLIGVIIALILYSLTFFLLTIYSVLSNSKS